MHPQLIHGFPIQTFGLCVAIGIVAAWTVMEKISGRKDVGNLVFLMAFCGIAGARAAHVIEYWKADGFDKDPLSVFAVWNGGLVFYGGLAAGLVAFALWCAVKREKPLPLLDLFGVGLPLGHAFGRLGCFFHGCCWGKVSGSWAALTFPPGSPAYGAHHAFPGAARSLPLLPTQLFESAALFALFAVLFFVYRRSGKYTAALYMSGYAVVRFFMEFLRDDERPSAFGLSSAQIFSVGLFAAGILLLAYSTRSRAKASDSIGR